MHNLSIRSRLLGANLASALLVLGVAGPTRAAEGPSISVALVAPSCAPAVVDVDALAVALRTNLPAALGATATVTPKAVDGAAYRIDLACSGADTIDMTLSRATPRSVEHDRISVADVERARRPGTVALALAERVRLLRARAGEPAPTPPVAKVAPDPPPTASPPDTNTRRVRLMRNLTIGFAALTVAAAVIGGPLVTVGGDQDKRALTSGGVAVLSVGGAALIATCVSFGLWLHERRR